MLNEANEIEYEKAQPQQLSGSLETIDSTIANVTERLKYTNQQYKPNVKFQGNTVTFVGNVFKVVDQRTKEDLKKQFTTIFKTILDTAKQDLSDAGIEYSYNYSFVSDTFSVEQSRGFGSKAYVAYTQTWELEII